MEENKPSYEDIFLRYYPPLTAFAFSFIKDEDAAKDIVQSVFIKIFEKRDTLIVQQSLKSYLYKAVSNACINHRKKEAVRSHHNASYAKELIESSFEDAVEQAEEDYKVYDAIKKLPPQCQKIFVMSRLDNRKNQEIADELSISIRTVETQISNALRTLKKAVRAFLL
jgi:RNA polymerase sigma-70 factor (family 1)